jgi:hypothetical protein
MVNPALKPQDGQAAKVVVPEPTRRGAEEATAPQDWTIHRPKQEKVEDPPPKPISQVLMDHLKTVWTASASAIQIEQVKNQLTQPQPVNAADVAGQVAKEVLVYTPSKIKKTENI